MDDCTFCGIVARDIAAEIVWETDDVVAFLDARPVFFGHTLVVPRAHVPTLLDLTDPQVPTLFVAVRTVAAAMGTAFGAQGTFVATNNVVSQSVPHLHVHVVPRTKGDGLRGFFWPRRKYESDDHLHRTGEALRAVLGTASAGAGH